MIKGHTTNGAWTTAVAHGFYMAVVPVGTSAGSSSTHYCDIYWINTSIGRVVYRGYHNAYANGGVSFANATTDASSTFTFVGSRLAFRGNLVRAQSVAAYKAIIEVA